VQNSLVISGYTQQNQPCPFSLSTPDSISRTARYSLVPGISVCAPTRQAAFVPLLRSSSVELSGARVILWRGSDSRNHKKLEMAAALPRAASGRVGVAHLLFRWHKYIYRIV